MSRVLLEEGLQLISNNIIGLRGVEGMSHEDVVYHGLLLFILEVKNAQLVSNTRGVWMRNRDLKSSTPDTGLVVLE